MKSGLRSVALALAAPTAALIFAVIASSIFLLIAGSNPINAYGDMIEYGSQLEIQVDIPVSYTHLTLPTKRIV